MPSFRRLLDSQLRSISTDLVEDGYEEYLASLYECTPELQ